MSRYSSDRRNDGAGGSFGQPAEVTPRGNELIVVNMDMAYATPGLSVNTMVVDDRYNLSVMDLAAPVARKLNLLSSRHDNGAARRAPSSLAADWRPHEEQRDMPKLHRRPRWSL